MSVLSVYRDVFNASPAFLDLFERLITSDLLETFVDARMTYVPERLPPLAKPSQIYPLVSHHRFNPHSLFGSARGETINHRILTLLLAHDGLVISDPTVEVVRLHQLGDQAGALRELANVTHQLAEVEPLLDQDVLRLTSSRPSLTGSARREVFELFGLDPDFSVFTKFDDFRGGLPEMSEANRHEYLRQCYELFVLFGVPPTKSLSPEEAGSRVADIARALIHLSWQVAVCSEEPACDLVCAGTLENSFFASYIEHSFDAELAASQDRARHFSRVGIGDLPGLDTLELSIADALAMRNDDVYETYRDGMHSAMDELDKAAVGDLQGLMGAENRFRSEMRETSRTLSSSVKNTPFRRRLLDASVPAALNVVTASLSTQGGPWSAAAIAGGGRVMTFMWQWLTGRSAPGGRDVAIRYSTQLGASPRRLGR